jgi:uncharacterized protein (UPF0147 family)
MISLEDRLMNDSKFRQLVEVLFMYIMNADFTPTEIREAAMLAQIKFESTRMRSYLIDGLSVRNK